MTCGIYMIKNKKTGQIYIGQSNNIEKRYRQHCNHNAKGHSYVERAIEKYGNDSFDCIVIEELPNSIDILNQREKYWINYYNTYNDNFHYNLTEGGDINPMKDKRISEKVRVKNQEYWNNGGREEQSIRFAGKNNPFYGKHHNEKTIQKIKNNQTLLYGEDNSRFKKSNNTIYIEIRKGRNKSTKQGFSYYYIENSKRIKKCQKFSDLVEWCRINNKKLTKR